MKEFIQAIISVSLLLSAIFWIKSALLKTNCMLKYGEQIFNFSLKYFIVNYCFLFKRPKTEWIGEYMRLMSAYNSVAAFFLV